MTAADPTYPFLPVMCILASVLLTTMLLNGLIRQKWNTGVAFLCFWLLVNNLIQAVGTIAWSDNFTIKFYIYCDISTHLHFMSDVAQPMATFIITRRLYSIASLRSVDSDSEKKRRWNLAVEWIMGFAVPVVTGGPIYYIVQALRFQVTEGFGCQSAVSDDALANAIVFLSQVLVPILSVTLYYPRIVWVFYFQRRDVDRFLRSNNSISRVNYFRVLALSSIDILFTLPVNATNDILQVFWVARADGGMPFYRGWDWVHTDWEPMGTPYDVLRTPSGNLAQIYLSFWASPVLAFIAFGLFGLTAEARVSYHRGICTVARQLGWNPTSRRGQKARSTLGSIRFGVQSPDMSLDSGVGMDLSFVNRTRNPAAQADDSGSGSADVDSKTEVSGELQSAPRVAAENVHVQLRALEKGTIEAVGVAV